jgi:hypothetical protein
MVGRELVAWVPDEPADPSLFALEDSGTDGWDQFAVNKVGRRCAGGLWTAVAAAQQALYSHRARIRPC